jgi:hypothetical protein
MIATAGHIALIVPDFAQRVVRPTELGIYEYEGEYRWRDCNGVARHYFYVGLWG